MKNNDRFNSGEPGIGLEIARWVVDRDLSLTGADTWAVEVVPNPDKGLAFPVHSELQTKHGIVNHENLVFDDLIADRKYQFVFIFPPTPIRVISPETWPRSNRSTSICRGDKLAGFSFASSLIELSFTS